MVDYRFFKQIDNNDVWSKNCMSLVCSEKHNLRKNQFKLDM